jgi:hypothetical protein
MSIQQIAMRSAKKTEFFVRKNAPTILTVAGVGGFVATTAFTIRATAKAVDMLPVISKRVQQARDEAKSEEMNEKDASVALAKAYVENAILISKIYAPTLAIGSASIICVLSAHGMMLKRQASVVALYAAMDASFKAYRSRVAAELGEEKELDIYRRPTMRALDGEEGGEPPVGLDGEVIDMFDVMPSPYARFFDETSRNWTKTPEYNLMFLRAQQDWANDRLRAYGYLFLNEVYEALGLPRSQAGQIVGWKLNNDGEGDGHVDFGLYAIGDECNRAFVNGIEHTVLLDFNVDGVIKI